MGCELWHRSNQSGSQGCHPLVEGELLLFAEEEAIQYADAIVRRPSVEIAGVSTRTNTLGSDKKGLSHRATSDGHAYLALLSRIELAELSSD